jgi:hypothetical protein
MFSYINRPREIAGIGRSLRARDMKNPPTEAGSNERSVN